MAGSRSLAALGLVAALVALSGAAAAHREDFPKRDRLELSPTAARLVIQYLVPAGAEARTLRRLCDRDRSGDLSGEEQETLSRLLAQQAAAFAALAIDDQAVALRRSAVTLDSSGDATAGLRVVVTLTALLTLAPGAHAVRFQDRHQDRRVAVPVQVALTDLVRRGDLPPLPLLGPESALAFTVSAGR